MVFKVSLFVISLLCCTFGAEVNSETPAAEPVVACYVGTWAYYRQGLGTFNTTNINPFACTELLYSFFGISETGNITLLDSWLDIDLGYIAKFNDLKLVNPKLKTVASVGGWNEGSEKFAIVSNNATLRENFAKAAVDFCVKYGFDGVNMDWEYPMERNNLGFNDRDNFNLLLKAMKEAFSPLGLILSIAVRATETAALNSYNIPEMFPLLNHIHIMAYDLHLPSENFTGFNAPLYASASESGAARDLNVDAILKFWTSVVPPSILTLGTPMYGHSFLLADVNDTKPGAVCTGPGPAGPYTQEAGTLSYGEVCLEFQNEGWTKVDDAEQKVPYAYKENVWVSYDNPESIISKGQLAMSYGLAGLMTWSLESDDNYDICGQGKSPLLAALNTAVGRKIKSTESTTTTIEPATFVENTSNNNKKQCKAA